MSEKYPDGTGKSVRIARHMADSLQGFPEVVCLGDVVLGAFDFLCSMVDGAAHESAKAREEMELRFVPFLVCELKDILKKAKTNE